MSTAGPGGAAPSSLSPQLFKAYTSYHKARFALAASLFRQAEEIVAQEAGDAELVSAYLRLLRASALDLQAQALHKADTERLRGEEFIELREEQWTHVKAAMGVIIRCEGKSADTPRSCQGGGAALVALRSDAFLGRPHHILH